MIVSWLKQRIPPTWKLMLRMRRSRGRWRLGTPDRVFLEDTIIPYFTAQPEVKKVLDIGVDWYTKTYPKLFKEQEYWTIDVDPEKEVYAGKNHHTASMGKLSSVFPPQSFDLVLCNGVIGWGVNDPVEAGFSLDECAAILRPGGWLVLGWNDIEERRVPGVEGILEAHFERFVFPPVKKDRFLTRTPYRHCFDFLRRC